MRCLDERKIQVFVDNRVEPKEYGRIMAHLAECEVCQAKTEEEKRMNSFVKRSALIYGETGPLEKTILTKIAQLRREPQWVPEPEPVSILRWVQPWAIQVAAFWIAAVFLGGWLGLIIGTPLPKGALISSNVMRGSLVGVLSERAEGGRS